MHITPSQRRAIKKKVKAQIVLGSSYAVAAAKGGIDKATLQKWRKMDPEWDAELDAAREDAAEEALSIAMACLPRAAMVEQHALQLQPREQPADLPSYLQPWEEDPKVADMRLRAARQLLDRHAVKKLSVKAESVTDADIRRYAASRGLNPERYLEIYRKIEAEKRGDDAGE